MSLYRNFIFKDGKLFDFKVTLSESYSGITNYDRNRCQNGSF